MPAHSATHCSTVQHSATHCLNIQSIASWLSKMAAHPATHCRTPQHTTIHCSTPTLGWELIFENVSKPCNSLQQTTIHSNNLQYRLLRMFTFRDLFYLSWKGGNVAVCLYLERWGIHFSKISTLRCVAVCCSVLQCIAACCTVLQYVAVRCSVLQSAAVCVHIAAHLCLARFDNSQTSTLWLFDMVNWVATRLLNFYQSCRRVTLPWAAEILKS